MVAVLELPDLRVARYRFTLKALEPLHLPPYKGSALRGGFGQTLKRLTCFNPGACADQCQLGNTCVYGYLFETTAPAEAEVLSKNEGVPRPFVIEPPLERQEIYAPGEQLDFHLVLFGRGIAYLPYFVLTFQQLGHAGLGRRLETLDGRRGRFALEAVWALGAGEPLPVFDADTGQLRSVELSAGPELWEQPAAAWPTERLTVEFLTPTRLRHADRWVHAGPPFAALVKALLSRLSSLAYFHGGVRWETDFRGWIDRAAEVDLAQATTTWVDWERYSGRQQQRIEMGGLVGAATYTGALAPYRPLLALAEYLHVGKGAVFGNGWLRPQPV